jgi:hypothetical protein
MAAARTSAHLVEAHDVAVHMVARARAAQDLELVPQRLGACVRGSVGRALDELDSWWWRISAGKSARREKQHSPTRGRT